MPPKSTKAKGKAGSAACPPGPPCTICSSEVASGVDDPVTCGICKRTAHRYCAGVSVNEYSAISTSSPYTCLACFKREYVSTVGELKDCISALKAEVAELRNALAVKQAVEAEGCTSGSSDSEWTVVAKAKRRGQRNSRADKSVTGKKPQWHSVQTLPARPASHNKASQDSGSPSRQSSRSSGKSLDTHARETVEGVRRVWGTLRNCTYRTVLATLRKLTSVAENVEVRRKFKKRDGSEIRWWFLIRGDESVLQTLQMEWENVENSTTWKLELCHRPSSPTPEQLPQPNGVINSQEADGEKTPDVSPFLSPE